MAMDRLRKLSAILDDDAPDDAAMEALLSQSSIAPEVDDTLGPDAAALDASVLLPRTPTGDFACVECVVHAAELFCEQCHDYFCELCFGGQHRKGGRRTHTSQPVVAASVAAAIATTSQPMEVEQGSVNGQANKEGGEDEEEGEEEEEDDDSDDDSDSDDASEDSGAWRAPARRRSICNLMGNLFLGVFAGNLLAPTATPHHARLLTSEPSTNISSVRAAEAQGTVLERAKSIPVRLTYEERKLLRTLEAALSVSHYTDKLDAPAFTAPAKRLRTQLQEICGFLSGIMVGLNYKQGQAMLEEKNFSDKAAVFQEIFELGRRYKIMNPEKMRGEYGKLMYIMQDAMNPEIQELLGFSCHTKIRTVYDVLEEANALGVLRDSKIETATMVVAPEGKTRTQIQRQIKLKENAIKAISSQYINSKINRDGIQQCLYSIADNNYHLYFERDPIDRMIQLLTHHFDPRTEDDGYSLAIVSGQDGARLSHSHTRQYNYVLQSLTLWREIAHDMFRLWCLTDDDLLDGAAAYTLSDTGQGLHRLQSAPRVSRAMHVILHMTQRKLENWVGSSVIHLGDKNVPNALMFIDKYTQVGHILRPIVKTVDAIDGLVAANSKLDKYITTTFGGAATLKRAILSDFFREAFDGSGADNFFEAGSCIDGRLTSAWNWCSNLPDKPFFPVFKIAGFVGFDGKFA